MRAWTAPPLTAQERLLEAYRQAERIERCACGGSIRAGGSEDAIRTAVEMHQATPVHAAWSRRMGFAMRGAR